MTADSAFSIPCVVHRGPNADSEAEKGLLEGFGLDGARLGTARAVADGGELILAFTLAGTHFEGVRARAAAPARAGTGWTCAVRFDGDWPARIQQALLQPRHEAILLLEDDAAVRQTVEQALRSAGYRVLACETVAQAIKTFEEAGCDLAVIDLALPDGSGMRLLERIRADARRFATPTVIFTADARLESKLAGLAFGADHYLTKPIDSLEMLFWVASLLRRTQFKAEAKGLIAFERGEIDPGAHAVRLGGREVTNLSRKEFDLLYRLVAGRPRVLSKRYILSVLWHTVVTDNTVEVHIKRLRDKLGPEGAARIVTVPGKGYKFI